jgi:DNA-directed RNA polymerase subunit RPC12/RpoP
MPLKPFWCCSSCGRPIVAVGAEAKEKLEEHKKSKCPAGEFKIEQKESQR